MKRVRSDGVWEAEDRESQDSKIKVCANGPLGGQIDLFQDIET